MKEIIELGMKEKKESILVSSRIIAEKFEKTHNHVLRDIDVIVGGLSKIGDTPSYFIRSKYFHEQNNQEYPEYLITRDGFSLLAMGFTGNEALKWKIKYINAFNQMESSLRERSTTEWLQTRKNGKLARRQETDAIALLKAYAEKQRDGKEYKHIYVNYTNLVNNAVGLGTDERLTASYIKLNHVLMLEDMIQKTVIEMMEQGVFYKNIYDECKAKVSMIAKALYMNNERQYLIAK